MRAPNLQRLLHSLESQLFNLELDVPGVRQQEILQKLQEKLQTMRTIPLNGKEFVLDPRWIQRRITRLSGLSLFKTKKLLKSASLIPTMRLRNLEDLLLQLMELGLGFEEIVGLRMGRDTLVFHYIHDATRFRHALGLADAVHMSLFNLGMVVRFPSRKMRTIQPGDELGTKRIYFRPHRQTKTTHVVHARSTKERKFRLLLHYLRVFPKNVQEKEFTKLIKISLNTLFSQKMNQEIPDGSEIAVPIFPSMTQYALDRCLKSNEKLRVRFYFNLIQSKALCAPVGEDMIEEAYVKHKNSLCRDESKCQVVPDEFLRKLRIYGEKVGERVNEIYDPHTTSLPNSKSCEEKNRKEGGAREALSSQRSRIQGPIGPNLLDTATRVEPFVVALFGPPGSGKTTLTQQLVRTIGQELFPSFSRSSDHGLDLVYSRDCSSKHWDKYRGQPIVVLDDFGQNLDDRTDIVEFEQLVSVNRFILPMAELTEKGQAFVSPIIILTSNTQYGGNLNIQGSKLMVEESVAVWRRMHLPLLLTKLEQGGTKIELYNKARLFDTGNTKSWVRKYNMEHNNTPYAFHSGRQFHDGVDVIARELTGAGELSSLISSSFKAHNEYHDDFLSSTWTQRIACNRVCVSANDGVMYNVHAEPVETAFLDNDYTLQQEFPSVPPFHAPTVTAIALPEPLKVRMITKAESETKCLQPLQKALFEYLGECPQFCLTNGCSKNKLWDDFESEGLSWIEKMEAVVQSIFVRKNDDEEWLSGDYTAATDNFPMSVTNALIEGILSRISHEPTKRWVRYECSPHFIKYPKGGIGKQTSGQLMGGLLSFPLLCFLNDFIVQDSGFEVGKYLINGDDVVAAGTPECIAQWRNNAPKVGLALSLGKNFIHDRFCTVNSQLFYDGECLHTGKVSCQTRLGTTLGYCFSETQFYFGTDEPIYEEFIRRNIIPLRGTPRSIRVSRKHGGLGLITKPNSDLDYGLAKKVFLYDALRPFSKSQGVPGFDFLRAVAVPEYLSPTLKLQLETHGEGEDTSAKSLSCLRQLAVKDEEVEQVVDLTHKDLQQFLKTQKTWTPRALSTLRLLNKRKFSEFPPSDCLSVRYIFVHKNQVGFVKEACRELALKLLLKLTDDPLCVHEDFFTDDEGEAIEQEANFNATCEDLYPLFSEPEELVEEEDEAEEISPSLPTTDFESLDYCDGEFNSKELEGLMKPDLTVELKQPKQIHPHDLFWMRSQELQEF